MPRIPKRFIALAGLAAGGSAGGAAAFFKRRRASRPTPPAPSPSAPPVSSAGASATTPVAAPPPIETPGPSVTPPRDPASDTERAERADATTPDPELLADKAGGPVDELVEAETAAAAAEAAGIGGPSLDGVTDDPSMQPVYEAGGGDAEGFEQAEADLIDNASHGGGGGDPSRDAFTPELESDIATGVAGEADEEKVSEVVEDIPEAETVGGADAVDDPGSGPGITHER